MGEIRMGIVSPDILKSAPSVKAVRSVLLGSVYLQDGTVAPIEKALEGTDDKLRMTPFTTRAVIEKVIGSAGTQSAEAFATAEQGQLADNAVQKHEIGSAAHRDVVDFATATQGELAETAIQPEHIGTAAKQPVEAFATAEQGVKADLSLPAVRLPIFAARETVAALSVAPEINAFRINESASPQASKGGLYVARSANPGHQGSVQDASGKWFEQVSADVSLNYRASNIAVTPPVAAEEVSPDNGPGVLNYFNTVFAAGGARLVDPDRRIYRSSMFGQAVGEAAVEWERVEAFGSGAMRFAMLGNRTTALGTLALQWQGNNDPGSYFHDFWIEGGNKPPTDSTWDAFGLESRNPGIARLGILAATYATSKNDVEGNVGLGRNALLHLVTGSFNTVVGYNSQAHAWQASRTTSFGYGAGRDNLFGDALAVFGCEAAQNHQSGFNDAIFGTSAARELVRGGNNTILGGNAGRFLTDAVSCVLIGYAAGQGLGVTTLNNTLVVQDRSATPPLLLGNFLSGKLAVGKPLLDDHQKASLSVITTAGVVGGANASADDFLIQENGNAGLTILTPSNAIGQIAFADAERTNSGGIRYDHTPDRMYFYADATNQLTLGAAGYIAIPWLPSTPPSAGSKRLWYDPADGNRIKYVP